MKPVVPSVAAMLFQQALATMGPLAIPVIGPVVVGIFDLNPGYIGAFAAITYGCGMASSLASGGAIVRYGALRLSQFCLLLCGIGLIVAGAGHPALFLPAAVLIGIGAGPSTPASSQILARLSPPRLAPLIFSIKQTGVPLGGIMAGMLFPWWLGLVGWQGALLLAASFYIVFAAVIQPLRRALDDERDPNRSLSLVGAVHNFRHVIRDGPLREMAIAICLFTGLQLTYGSFFVAFLVNGLGFDLAFAGLAFAFGQGAGFVGRILWGWIASRFVASRLLLGLLGIAMAATGTAVALIDSGWAPVAIVSVAIAFGATGVGFQGVLLAEVARLAPKGAAGEVTSAIVVFAYAGMMSFPAVIGAIVGTTGSYKAGILIAVLATLPITVRLLRPRRR